jgi:hypothetical protein
VPHLAQIPSQAREPHLRGAQASLRYLNLRFDELAHPGQISRLPGGQQCGELRLAFLHYSGSAYVFLATSAIRFRERNLEWLPDGLRRRSSAT